MRHPVKTIKRKVEIIKVISILSNFNKSSGQILVYNGIKFEWRNVDE